METVINDGLVNIFALNYKVELVDPADVVKHVFVFEKVNQVNFADDLLDYVVN